MEIYDSTIKRLYDEYKPQDFNFGDSDLNPKREMILDQMAIIEKKVQEATNEIVLKKIRKPQKKETVVEAAVNGEMPSSKNEARKEVASRAGSPDLNIFDLPKDLEAVIGSFPGSINELSLPPIIECEEILKKYDFESNYNVYQSIVDDEPVIEIYTESDDDDDEDDNEDSPVDDDEELDECADVELEFLKMILIILKVIKIVMTIIDYIISTVMIVIKIVCLAIGAWLNPPNIAQITQIVISMVIALVAQLVGKLIALLWSMLNMDCLANQTMEIIAQIQEAMNAFKSTMSMLNPGAISFFGDLLGGGLSSIKEIIDQLLAEKAEAWEKAREELSHTFSKEGLKKMSEDMLKQAKDAAIESANKASDGKLGALYGAVSGTVGDAIQIGKDAKKKFTQVVDASVAAYNAIIKGQGGGSTQNAAVNSIMSDPSIQGFSME